MMLKRQIIFICVFCLAAFFSLQSAAPVTSKEKTKKLTYEQVYLNAEPRILKPVLYGRYEGGIQIGNTGFVAWLDDRHFLLSSSEEKTASKKFFQVNAETGEKSLFCDFSQIQKNLPDKLDAAHPASVAPDFRSFVYILENDIYFYSLKNPELKRLTANPGQEKNPRFSPDGRFLAYTRDRNLYTYDLENSIEYQLTSDGSDTICNGWASWVYYEEILGRESRFAAFWWSPDSRRIAFLRFDDGPVPTFPLVRSQGTHGELEVERYPKSGDPNPYIKLGIAPATGGSVVWADIEEKADHYVAWPFWFADSSKLAFQWMNRGQDHIKIYTMDLKTGEKKEIYTETQAAWVNFFEDLYFFKNGSGFLLRSTKDGWSHLYYHDLEGKLKNRLTEGEWTAADIARVDEKQRRVFFHASKGSSTETHLFVVNLEGKGFKLLTEEPGTHHAEVSHEGSYFMDFFSSVITPSRLDLYRFDGTHLQSLEQSRTPQMEEYELAKKELFSIPAAEDWALPAYWILPPDFDENKKYPILFMIYGGPDSGTVSNTFPSLSELYLAQEGIIVFSVDHRGSGHFGKKGVDLMHRNLGKWEMHDMIEAVQWLRQKPFIDSKRIGITGGSYGGYTTCMALTYGADCFTHGYARSSVTDWKLYDSVYTERYMDKPCENPEGYASASVLTHAEKLKGVLFLSHGDMDDNVHMQNSIQLIDTLMDAGKPFEFMLYPNQRHSFRGKKRDQSNRHFVNFWFRHFLGR